jgi:hypothetical protein
MNKSLITINNQPLSKKDFFQAIDDEIMNLYATGNIDRAMKVLNGLDAVESLTGHAKAKLLWASSKWYETNAPENNFSDDVSSVTNLKKVTVDRYVLVWKYVEDLTIPKEISERPMRDLIPIAKTISQGYDISKEQWKKIDLCSNDGELRDVLRKIKGKAERKSATVIKISRDGSLNGWKDNKKYFLGFLNVEDAQNDSVIAEFIEKIKNDVGIIEV